MQSAFIANQNECSLGESPLLNVSSKTLDHRRAAGRVKLHIILKDNKLMELKIQRSKTKKIKTDIFLRATPKLPTHMYVLVYC